MRYCGIMICLTLILSACSSQPSQSGYKPPSIPVFVAEGQKQDVPVYIESLGILKPSAVVDIRPQVSGMIREVHFNDGQDVHAGAKLFTVDPEPYLIKLQETEALLAQNKATLNSSKKKLERYTSLSKKDLIAQQDWDELESQVMKNQAIVKGDEAKVASASRDLNNCIIRAPMEGRTGKAMVHPGNLVSASQPAPLVILSNYDSLVVEFTLTEKEFQQLTDDHMNGSHPVEICSFCQQGERTKGTLTFLNNSFDTDTGLLLMHGKLQNEEHLYLPGQTVKVKLPMSVLEDVTLIPQKAVKINQSGPYVYTVKEDNTVEIRQLKLGEEFEDKVVVLEGLAPGEKIVTDGHLRLAPGLSVEIKNQEGQP